MLYETSFKEETLWVRGDNLVICLYMNDKLVIGNMAI